MNPVCSASLCVNKWIAETYVFFTTYTEAHVMLAAHSLNEDINT